MSTKKGTNERCWKCNGTGKFYFGGAVVNGVYTGKIGACFGCAGKGYQAPSDRRRNTMYWRMNGGFNGINGRSAP